MKHVEIFRKNLMKWKKDDEDFNKENLSFCPGVRLSDEGRWFLRIILVPSIDKTDDRPTVGYSSSLLNNDQGIYIVLKVYTTTAWLIICSWLRTRARVHFNYWFLRDLILTHSVLSSLVILTFRHQIGLCKFCRCAPHPLSTRYKPIIFWGSKAMSSDHEAVLYIHRSINLVALCSIPLF